MDYYAPLLLPPDLGKHVAEDHLLSFIRDAVSLQDLSLAPVNHGGTGLGPVPAGNDVGPAQK